jgi:hypothetical protein
MKKAMNSATAPFSSETVISNWIPERLTFNDWIPNQGKSFLFLILPLDTIAIEPIDFGAIY